MNAIGATILVGLSALILCAPKRWALIAFMGGVLYLTEQQAIDVVGVNLTAMRVLEVAGLTRVIWRSEFPREKLNRVDQAVLFAYGYTTLVFFMRSGIGHAQMLGWMVDATFSYFILRAWLKNTDDLRWVLRVFVLLLAPYVVLLLIEMQARENPFSILGAGTWSYELRAGRIRCMGSFRHPTLLGTLGAALLPLYIGLGLSNRNRTPGLAGIALCSAIVLLSNSGGPLGASVMGIVGWLFWFARTKMFAVRLAFLGSFVMLALVMKAPIWYLPARVSSLTGGGGWHRSYLMDVAFSELDRWWFAGMDPAETVDWFPYLVEATGAADITNAYLDFGLKAGLLAMALFVLLLVRAFQRIGQALELGRRSITTSRENEYLLWGIGCGLVVHIVSWLGITYFDQLYVVWFMQLAAVSALSKALEVKRRTFYRVGTAQVPAKKHMGPVHSSRSAADPW
jgi:hypothetical protein